MKAGVFLVAGRFPGQDDSEVLRRSVDAVVCAEAAGFDEVWIAEHHFTPYGVCPSAVTFAAHALGMTRRIAVGTAVSVLSTAHPVALAEQAALLDHLAGGRFRLGVGRGGPWVDLEVFGTGLDRYERGFAESLDLVLDCLTTGRARADGEHFTFREVPIVPTPRPVPLAVAATSPGTVELAAARGLPMLLGMHIGDEDKAEMVRHYDQTTAALGRAPASVKHISTVVAHVADSREQACADLRAAMPDWLAAGLAAHTPVDDRPRPSRDPHAYTELLCSLHPVGSADECVERLLDSARNTGIEHVIMMVEGAGSHERTLANITRLGAEVLPRLGNLSSPEAPGSGSAADRGAR
ncbi:LLM class flavin-dependent oxidoreductase [Actinophytocola oryzae]|uniref:Alkanesulfonate monooxygenase SsuD/methylene tetrahydromethanopterin reductase-like flavin-dependent oxidoreductase (Luciferase family) n=1 Tax=Actinophytocola oryzae TaxID=502181 RepID=A0A4R7VH63_9PSEU|nr:LLM class flavin-dependent oxidoreductase [Actinophytocola oryzae]TDV48674.1 alkanesulfonate monooxygenase SsuD/methylene tetrahydromethanopterin reductase-like flavin-dependent oxidoreductase (luciferase family) [Actinophytocola oryzae]